MKEDITETLKKCPVILYLILKTFLILKFEKDELCYLEDKNKDYY